MGLLFKGRMALYGMHAVFLGVQPALFFRVEAFPQPGNSLIQSLVREGEGGLLFFLIRSLLEAPGLRINKNSEGGALLSVVSAEEIPHSVVTSGKRFLFQPAGGDQFFIDHGSVPFHTALFFS